MEPHNSVLEVLPKLVYFTSKTCSRVLGYSAIELKVCQKAGVWKKKPKWKIHVYMIIWKPLIGERLQCVKEPTNEVNKNTVAVVHTNSHCKEEVVTLVQQKSPWLYPCFYPCPFAFWGSLQPGSLSIMEVNMDGDVCKFSFYGPEKAIKLAKK